LNNNVDVDEERSFLFIAIIKIAKAYLSLRIIVLGEMLAELLTLKTSQGFPQH